MSNSSGLNHLYAEYQRDPVGRIEPLVSAVRRVALMILRDEDDAQDFMIEFLLSLPGLTIHSSFAGYIYQLAKWRRADYWRSRARRNNLEQQAPIVHGEDGETPSPEDVLDNLAYAHSRSTGKEDEAADLTEITDHVVRRAAELMPQGFTQAECAEMIGVKPAALRKRLQRYRNP